MGKSQSFKENVTGKVRSKLLYISTGKTVLSAVLLLILLSLSIGIYSLQHITVDYHDKSASDYIGVTYIDSIPYFNIYELNKTLNAFISFDIIDRRLFLDIYDRRLIFLLDTSYLVYDSEIFNFIHDIRTFEGKTYLPVVFLQRTLGEIFTDKLSYNDDTYTLHAQSPVDTSFNTIVIDPGHGGRDPGAIGISGRVFEKDVVLDVAKKVKDIVESRLDIRVLLTREDDRFLPLKQRTRFANQNNANLFISLHANAALNRTAEGVEVYFLSAARTDEARAVEIMENSVVEKYEGGKEAVKMYDDLSFILMDMAQAEHLRESSYFALKLQANMVKHTGAVDRGVKQAGFYVLRGAYMPSVLVELGFLSNHREERRLVDKDYQNKLANAIYEGLKSYIYNYEMFR